MVNIMVALDSSEHSKAAFYNALALIQNRETDKLILMSVVERISAGFTIGSFWQPSDIYTAAESEVRKSLTSILQHYGHIAVHEKVDCSLLLGTADHIGEMICEMAEEKKVDFLVMGRRGTSKISRIFVGSSSKYCVEHANCNVLVVKEISPEHSLRYESASHQIKSLDEMERTRRNQQLSSKMEDRSHGVASPSPISSKPN
eukprot:TRINITY_DN2290_c0_g1_i1.p1 TRINITY_DN2290_c0_g1~~TRINITY_DN2290_c0_g1_i1.p1  ORF type:complete len:202 (-),score=67.89 TRINITY_DN2290_c0_g1_i1:54-659(-)